MRFTRALRHRVLPPDDRFDVAEEEYDDDVVDSFDELIPDDPGEEGDESVGPPPSRGRDDDRTSIPLREDEILG